MSVYFASCYLVVAVQKVQHMLRVRILLALAHIFVEDSAASYTNVGRFPHISPGYILLFSKYRVFILWKPYYVPVTAGQRITSRICNCSYCASFRVLGVLHAFRVKKCNLFFCSMRRPETFHIQYLWNFGTIWWWSILGWAKFFRRSWALMVWNISKRNWGTIDVKSKF
jgi:hypothetical protein